MVLYREKATKKGLTMEKRIVRSAFFALCEKCECHGYIMCADRTVSNEFATIAGGLKELTALMLAGKIAEDEALEVERQIRESGFEQKSPEVDEIMERRSQTAGGLKPIFDELHRGTKDATPQMVSKRPSRNHRKTLH